MSFEIEKGAKGLSQMRVSITDPRTLRPLSRIRITLRGEEEEIVSYLTENGKVLFDSLPFGRYRIEVQDGPVMLAELFIKIRGNSHG